MYTRGSKPVRLMGKQDKSEKEREREKKKQQKSRRNEVVTYVPHHLSTSTKCFSGVWRKIALWKTISMCRSQSSFSVWELFVFRPKRIEKPAALIYKSIIRNKVKSSLAALDPLNRTCHTISWPKVMLQGWFLPCSCPLIYSALFRKGLIT
jgi:hypothetical protein